MKYDFTPTYEIKHKKKVEKYPNGRKIKIKQQKKNNNNSKKE